MNKWRIFLICLLGALTLSASAASKEKAPKEKKVKKEKTEAPKRVYMYGISTSLNDSTIYFTGLQRLDGVIITPDGCIQNYASYSQQLKLYLEGVLGETNQTCAVIYSEKKKKATKRYLKTQKEFLSDKGKRLHQIGTDVFVFKKQ